MKASAAHSAGRHCGDNSLPSGKTSGRTRTARPTAGAYAHVFTHSIAVENGSEPGECTSVYRAYAKGAAATRDGQPDQAKQRTHRMTRPPGQQYASHARVCKRLRHQEKGHIAAHERQHRWPNATIVVSAAAAQASPAGVSHPAARRPPTAPEGPDPHTYDRPFRSRCHGTRVPGSSGCSGPGPNVNPGPRVNPGRRRASGSRPGARRRRRCCGPGRPGGRPE